MNTETIDGSIITTLYTDDDGYTWHICHREGGSMSLYASKKGHGTVYVIYDTLDGQPPSAKARALIYRIGLVADQIKALRTLAINAATDALDTATPEAKAPDAP